MKEKIERLKYWERERYCDGERCDYECKKCYDAISEAIIAYEKQMPKKYKTNEFGDYVCPSCGMDIPKSIYNVSRMSTTIVAGCPFCLQAIDWGKETDNWINSLAESDKIKLEEAQERIRIARKYELLAKREAFDDDN